MADKSLDLQIYRDLARRPSIKNDLERKRRVLQTRILKLSPKDSNDSYERIGKLLFDAGKIKRCIFQLKKAIIVSPYFLPKTHIALATAFRRLKKYDQCISVIQKGLDYHPKNHELHRFSIKTLDELGKTKDFDSFYQGIAKIMKDPANISTLYFKIAELLASCGRYDKAVPNYQRAVETNTLQSSSELFFSRYTQALIRAGRVEKAINQFEQILKTDPNHRFSLSKRAYCYYLLGKVEKAFEEFEYIIQNNLHVEDDYGGTTFLPFVLVLYHLEKDEKIIKQYKERIHLHMNSIEKRDELKSFYSQEELLTRHFLILNSNRVDKETKEFHVKKQQALNKVIGFI